MDTLTTEQLATTVYVIIALFGALITVDKVVEIVKKWKAPAVDTAQKLANDKDRLDDHEKAIGDLQESSRVQCAALVAILDHELHNGNADQMEKARDGLMAYLQGLITKN